MQVSILHQVNILFKIKKPQLCMSVIQVNILLGEAIQWYPLHWWYKSTYYSKSRKHYVCDLSQNTFGWSNSVIPVQWLMHVNILFKIKKTQLYRRFKWTYFRVWQFRDVLIGISMTSSTQQIDTRGFVEKQWNLMCSLEFLWRIAHSR